MAKRRRRTSYYSILLTNRSELGARVYALGKRGDKLIGVADDERALIFTSKPQALECMEKAAIVFPGYLPTLVKLSPESVAQGVHESIEYLLKQRRDEGQG